MAANIERGPALVLVGPQGSGKLQLARQLAAEEGPSAELEAEEFQDDKFMHFLQAEPATLIVDGFPCGEATMQRLKALITNDEVVLHTKGLGSRRIKAPNLIFCTGVPPKLDATDRRFHVVHIHG